MKEKAIAAAIPFFLALIALEMGVDRRRRKRGGEPLYRFADSITSLACGVGQQMLAALVVTALGVGAYTFFYDRFRVLEVSQSSVALWILAFVGTDLGYYAYHRASHRINFFWATHVVHHQSEEYNLSTALRQSWFTSLTSWLFYVPLAILGVSPFVFVTCLTFNTLYQFWIHTRAIGKLGLVERVMNTPSHHRIHHAIDPEYIDKNYAGVFITWDKLFGTFIEEGVEPNYGTVKPLASMNSFWANFEGFARLWQMSRATKSWKDKVLVWVMPPEWQPEDLGGIVTVPHVDRDARVKYDVMKNRALFRYIGVQFVAAAGLVFGVLWYASVLGVLDKAALVSVTFLTLAAWGALLERRAWAMPTESARLVLLGLALAWVFRASDLVAIVVVGWALFAAASAWGLVASVREDRARRDDAARAQADDRDGALEPAG